MTELLLHSVCEAENEMIVERNWVKCSERIENYWHLKIRNSAQGCGEISWMIELAITYKIMREKK